MFVEAEERFRMKSCCLYYNKTILTPGGSSTIGNQPVTSAPTEETTAGTLALLIGRFRGAKGAYPPMAQNILNFMQFFGKFGNFVCWCPPPPPLDSWLASYGESWIRPCYLSKKKKLSLNYDIFYVTWISDQVFFDQPSGLNFKLSIQELCLTTKPY